MTKNKLKKYPHYRWKVMQYSIACNEALGSKYKRRGHRKLRIIYLYCCVFRTRIDGSCFLHTSKKALEILYGRKYQQNNLSL